MQLHPFVILFMILWCSVIAMGFSGLLSDHTTTQSFSMLLIPAGMLLFAYLLISIPFWIEVGITKAKIAGLFSGHVLGVEN